MAKLSNQAFYDKWVPLLADNVFQDIDGERFEQLLADMRDSFAQVDGQVAQPVPPAVNFDPMLRRLTAIHPLGVAELEYNHNNGGFTAYAPIQVDDLGHGQGEWRFRVAGAQGRNPSQLSDSPEILVKAGTGAAGPLSITANQISDASPAGRALLRAPTTDAQLAQLDYLRLVDYPNLVRVYGDTGAVKYLLDQVKQLVATAAPGAPVAPTDGQVEDTADTFSGKLVPGYSAVADYEVFGAPGFPGTVNAAAAGGDVQNGRIYSRGLTGSLLVGGAGIRVAASGNRPAGAWLLSDKPFTASASTTTPGTGTVSGNAVDLLGLSNDQMLEVMSLLFDDNNDSGLGDAPAWSRFGMSFDAEDANGDAWHFYVGRGTYKPYTSNEAGEGESPRWSRVTKIKP